MNKYFILIVILFLFLAVSCKTKVDVNEDNKTEKNSENHIEKTNDNKEKNITKSEKYIEEKIIEKKEYFSIDIEIVNGISEIFINNESKGVSPISLTLEKGTYYITLKRKDYPDQICKVDLFKNHMIKLKHNKDNLLFKEVGIFECGEQPKQVVFSPDDNFIFVPLLDDYGFQIFDVREFRITQFVKPNRANQGGFAEGIFIENRDGKTTFCISQMTTGYIYEYTYPQMELKREIQTGGKWPKYIAYSKTLNLIAVSNWASNNVSIIDYETGKVIKLLETDASPRGIIFTNDGNYLIVLNFDGGTIQKFATKNWKQEKVIFKQNAAMRHIVLNSDNTKAYVSNMYHFEIYEIDVEKFKILKTYKVYYNPNTIDLKDDKLLFVSSRGPNDEESYLKRSPKNGKITVIDVEKQEIINIFEGGNQPTGLDVSNNGKYLCFSNFRDRNIEIYYIGDYQ